MSDEADNQPFRRLRQPITIGSVTAPNRIVRTAHATGYALGAVSEQLIAYHEARARGGVGLMFIEIAGVHRSSPGSINLYRGDAIEGLAALAARVHAHGALVFQQLWHGGPNAHAHATPAWAASAVPEPMGGRVPVPMTQAMIDDVIEAFAAGARRCREAGLDGVELHGAHGYLVCSFLSPATNHRADDYGGSLENRARFAEQVLAAIRSEVGPDFPVGIRLSASEAIAGGLEPADTAAVAARLEERGLVDYVDVSLGDYYSFPKLIGAMHEPLLYQLPTSSPVTAAVSVPTIVTGRVMDLHDAERIVADGIADMVSMVRATIADPDLVRKSFAGEADRVRPCLSCNEGCIGGVYGPTARLGCAVNPTAGREARTGPLEAAGTARQVLVVGGGPAGLEAAWTAASRDHAVRLCEAADEVGGQLQLARRAPFRQDIAAITDWLAAEVQRLGVDVRTGTPLDADDVAAQGADVVIVATGSEPLADGSQRFRPGARVEGVGLPHVATAADVLGGWHATPRRALVFDDLGLPVGVSVAELLLERGASVTVATSLPGLGAAMGPTLQRDPARARLGANDEFSLLTRMALLAVTPTHVRLEGLDDGRPAEVEADLVVLVSGSRPRRGLYDELVARGVDVHLAGDALDPAGIQAAIASGRRAGSAV
jgi:2,4-dienoyl-CoA reductase-like NADH-dependent reductase (Old Yellow Enzyme family)